MPILRCQIFGLLADSGPGIVNKDVEPAEPLDGCLDCLTARFFIYDIQIHKFRLRPE